MILSGLRDSIWLARQNRALRLASRERRERQLQFYSQLFGPGDLVFDVGANVGDRTDVFAQLGARVVAFEPLPALVETLHRRFAGRDDVLIRPTGLGAAPGTAPLSAGHESTISSMSEVWRDAVAASGRFAEHQWAAPITVPLSTLDVEISAHGLPRFCKIDVEGFELEVVRGLSRPIPALSVEYTHELSETTEACLDHLAQLGSYRFAFSPGESMALWSAGWGSLDETASGLRSLEDPLPWGDVYARLETTSRKTAS